MVFNATFNNISVTSWWRKPEYPEKTIHLPQVTDKFITYCCIEYTTLVVIGTDCTGICKSNYHMIMTMTSHQNL